MIIAMSCSKEWYKYLVVDLYALLEYTTNIKKIYLLVETENIDKIPYLKEIMCRYEVEIKLINLNTYIEQNIIRYDQNWNKTDFSNFCFGMQMLPNIVQEEKVIYIDTDAIVKKDISEIWDLDISDYYIAGVKNIHIINNFSNYLKLILDKNNKYINSGFIVFNLKKIRSQNIHCEFINIMNKINNLMYPYQDALNIVYGSKALYLPSIYNYTYNCIEPVDDITDVKVFHYAGAKGNWIEDKENCEKWYHEEKYFYRQFGWYKYENIGDKVWI